MNKLTDYSTLTEKVIRDKQMNKKTQLFDRLVKLVAVLIARSYIINWFKLRVSLLSTKF